MRRGTPIETFVERHSGGGGVVGWVGQGLSLIKLDNKLTQLQLPLDAPLDGLWWWSYWLQMLRDIIFSLLFSFISGNKRVISSITSQRKEGRESRESEQRFTFYNAIQPARSLLGNKWNNWNSIHYTVYVSIQYVLSVWEWQARMSMNTKTNKLQHVQSLHLPLSKLNIQTSDNSLFPNVTIF